MDPVPMRQILRSIRSLSESEGDVPEPDARLLERFVASRDAAAFELLLWRHGPMVLSVCRRLLPHPQDADDAFQATFLTLVKKAGSVAKGSALASWLYQVAYRVALRARMLHARRARQERPGVEELAAPPDGEPLDPDLRRVLDEEVNRLPRRHREVFVLCCLEGKTGAEAARLLGCRPGTVSSRLTRARERLRRRLLRRGVAPAVAATAAVLHGEAGAVTPSTPLVHSTLKASLLFAAGEAAGGVLSSEAVTLAKGALRSMTLSQLKVVALGLLVACVFAAGAVLGLQALEAGPIAQENGDRNPERAQARVGGEEPQKNLPSVRVMRPLPGGLERTSQQPCSVHAAEEAELIPLASGMLVNLKVTIGTRVRRGEVLVEIDNRQLVLEERQAGAVVRQAEGLIREGEARVSIAKAEVQSAQRAVSVKEAEVNGAKKLLIVAQREVERLQSAMRQPGARSVSANELSLREAEADAARSKVDAALAAVVSSQADVDIKKGQVLLAGAAASALTAKLEEAKLAQENSRLVLDQARIVSPLDGVVTDCNVRNGEYVRSGATGAPTPILTVKATDRLRVVVLVPEWEAQLTQKGVPVELSFDALPGMFFKGAVARTAFALDAKTHTMRAEVDLPNPRGLIRPGMSGQATLHLLKPANAFRIPESALIEMAPEGSRPFNAAVYVVRGGKAIRTGVRKGPRLGGEVEIFAEIGPNDLVVTDPRGLSGEVVAVDLTEKNDPGKK